MKSPLKTGLLIGAAIGVATASFLKSKKGKALTKDLMKKTHALQKKVNAELKKMGNMTKEKYEELVDKIVAYYVTTKDIAKSEVPEVKKCLMDSWKSIEKEMKSV